MTQRSPRGKKPSQNPSSPVTPELEGTVADRRVLPGRRHEPSADSDTGLERRRGPGRRRTDFTRNAEEGEMSKEQFLFLMAIDAFKRVNGKTFPTWTDVLEIIRRLGYRKVQACTLNLQGAEDWIERADAPLAIAQSREAEQEDDAWDEAA